MRGPYSALLGWLSHARCLPPWPFSPGPSEATSLREVPASLPLLPRPGRPPPTRGASLLGPTPAASQSSHRTTRSLTDHLDRCRGTT